MRELLIATSRKGKLDEIRAMLEGAPFIVLGLSDAGLEGNVEEVGSTYEGNALIKAFTYGKRAGKLSMSEDSGLEIDFMDGRPGVFTAQYGEGTSDFGCQRITDDMKDVPDEKRGAQFRSTIVIYDPVTDKVRITEGVARGTITREIRGKNGFHQDPIFEYDESGKTGGEMTVEEKNAVSHRSKAFAKARETLLYEFV